MRDTPPPTGQRPAAATPAPAPVRMAGSRSGEGAASVMEHMVQDRMRYARRKAGPREPRA